MPTHRNDEGPSVAALGLLGHTQLLDGPKLTAGLQALQISALPAWGRLKGVDNLRDVSADLQEHIARAAIDARLQFGTDPCTRAQAAAHEAGHVLVEHALGERVEGARIARHDEHGYVRWLGCNQYEAAHGRRWVHASDNPELVLRSAAISLAGFAGEDFAGLSHPASSIDERSRATVCCSAVAKTYGLEVEDVASRVGAYCLDVFTRNRTAFDVVRGHLYRTKRLNRSEAVRMLASVRQSAPAWLGGTQ